MRRDKRMPEPVRTIPTTEPIVVPDRRLEPERLCPAQKGRVVRRLDREVKP